MSIIKLNEATAARKTVYFFASDDDSADQYAPQTGITFAAAELKVSKGGAAEANSTGSVAEIGGGWYAYTFAAAEINTLGPVLLRTARTDTYTDAVLVQVVAYDPYDVAGLGLSNLDNAVSTRLAAASYASPDTVLTASNGVETGLTLQQALRLMSSVLVGRVSGAGTGIEVFRNAVADNKNRVTATIDTSGNRTNITTDLT